MTHESVPAGAPNAPAALLRSAQVVVPCAELDPTLGFFTDTLGMRVEAIFPADDPAVAVVTGLGVRLRLDATQNGSGAAIRLRLLCDDPASVAAGQTTLTAPNGTVVDLVDAEPPVDVPPVRQSLVITRLSDDAAWHAGRAGMLYRDLLPEREGGRFIASHIAIPDGGPVQDYVHFHRVRFQMIYVRRGWVRLVYEGQGEPFVMHEGDCVLQPPTIRHQVLETSAAFEVIEVGCPAEHETFADLEMALPSPDLPAAHTWWGQRFVHHVAADAVWDRWRAEGFEQRDLGIAAATDGLAGVRVARPITGPDSAASGSTGELRHAGELWFAHLVEGTTVLTVDGRADERLVSGDTIAVPAGTPFSLSQCSADLALLEVTLPA
jgi:mannose-6-phosphate isomerase-like protein (cupin superfamily)